MSRSIDPDRPCKLTFEQSQSAHNSPRIQRLLALREQYKADKNTPEKARQTLNRELTNEGQPQRHALLKQIRHTWESDQPIREIEEQLAGLSFNQGMRATRDSRTDLSPERRALVEAIVTLPGSTLEEECKRRNQAIAAVTAYCNIDEGGSHRNVFHTQFG